MNMNKALQHLYKAVSGNDTSKVNISKLLVDIHYAITGVESPVKNNWSKIIDSIATNWTGGGGSSDFSTATVTLTNYCGLKLATCFDDDELQIHGIVTVGGAPGTYSVPLYKGHLYIDISEPDYIVTGSAEIIYEGTVIDITGDCTITESE